MPHQETLASLHPSQPRTSPAPRRAQVLRRCPASSARSHGRERGVMTAMFAVLAVFLVLIMSVLAEGGRKLNNLGRAEDLAAEVARSAAATLDLELIAEGVARIDVNESGGEDATGRARTEANRIVDAINDAEIERFVVADDRVYVEVRVSGTSFIPGFSIDGIGSHQALAFDPFG